MEASSGAAGPVTTSLADWFATPLGHYLLAREQAWFDRTVADIFGFTAIQIGIAGVPVSHAKQGCLAVDRRFGAAGGAPCRCPLAAFPDNSLDLIVLPHALEFTTDPHQLLREVYRAMRAEGQIVISGFNPFSLFGAKRYFGHGESPPWNGGFIALYRLKDWLALLGFEVTGGGLDCYVPPFENEKWRARFGFFEAAGDRWWPIAGACTTCARRKRSSACASSPGVGAPRERPRHGAAPGAPVHRARRNESVEIAE
jgi:SAM-dependent methyltransferase